MKTEVLVKLLVMHLMLGHIWSIKASLVGIDRICAKYNGTVCNPRPPGECRSGELEQRDCMKQPPVNPETIFHVTVIDENTDSTNQNRYLKLEWTQVLANQSSPTFVCISQLKEKGTVQEHLICMTNHVEMNKSVKLSPLSNINRKDYSTVAPLLDGVKSWLVEIHANQKLSQYLVEVPKRRESSWIITAAIAVHNNKAYISLSLNDSLMTVPEYRDGLTVTLHFARYKYLSETYSQDTIRKSLNIDHRILESERNETKKFYDRGSINPVEFEMQKGAYKLYIDAKIYSSSLISETHIISLFFGRSESVTQLECNTTSTNTRTEMETDILKEVPVYKDSSTISSFNEQASAGKSSGPVTQEEYFTTLTVSRSEIGTDIFNGVPVDQDSNANSSFNELASAAKSSGSLPGDEEDTTISTTRIVWGVSLAFVALLFACLVKAVGLRRCRIRQVVVKTETKSEHFSVLDERKFDECCTCQTSDTSSNKNAACPLINHYYNSNKTFKNIRSSAESYHSSTNTGEKHSLDILNLDNSLSEQQFEDQKASKQICLICEKTPPKGVIDQTLADASIPKPPLQLNHQVSIHRSSGYFSAANEHPFIAPKISAGSLDSLTMIEECVKINMVYEDLTGNKVHSRSHASDYENLLDDECFSICDSIAC